MKYLTAMQEYIGPMVMLLLACGGVICKEVSEQRNRQQALEDRREMALYAQEQQRRLIQQSLIYPGKYEAEKHQTIKLKQGPPFIYSGLYEEEKKTWDQ